MPSPVMMVRGLWVCDTPSLCGKALSQKTMWNTISIIIRGGNSTASAFEFGIAQDVGDPEALLSVCAVYFLQSLGEGCLLAVVQDCSGDESYIARYRQEKWNFVYEHYIDA
jgi:hypothetical protein